MSTNLSNLWRCMDLTQRNTTMEALINSPEISSLIKEQLRSKFDRANELAVSFSESKLKRKLDKNNGIVRSLHALNSGEISSANCCSNEFRSHTSLYRHIVAVHPNFYVDDSITQDESADLSQIQGNEKSKNGTIALRRRG
ncbi:hypothetical protein DERF_000518 [Dermatophagoides farinae]|uniref:Uncharacterized protein n=1 Tax=Dermatophagoides farinae TaxID=6954 RepID=A0A922LA92_DERFA|nr:hypothetical protein DERF_000518 [Dermatophagoides farinae]